MLRERVEFTRGLLYFFELAMLSVGFFGVYGVMARHVYMFDFYPGIQLIQEPRSLDLYFKAYWLSLGIWAILLKYRGAHRHLRMQNLYGIFFSHLVSGTLFLGILAGCAFLLKYDFLSRAFMLVYAAASVVILWILSAVVVAVAFTIRRRGYNYRNIIVVGTSSRSKNFAEMILRHREWGFRILGFLDFDAGMTGQQVLDHHKVIGTVDELPKILETNVVDQVVFIVPRKWIERIEKYILYCESVGVPATVSTDFFNLGVAMGVPQEMEGFTYITFRTRLLRDEELMVKRTFDIIVSSVALILSAPLLAVIAVLVRTSSKGPVFFKQVRSGRNGARFMLYKFRSMVPDAEARLQELQKFNEMSGPVFKMTEDPRLTRIGKFIRKTSLDEFPQFWNVLKGDMSIVGPRPPLPSEVEKYEPWQRRRLSMKPGITCLWQVSGRNEISFEEWMKLDLQYIDNWSIWLDFKIIIRTFKAVFSARGAK